MKRLGYGEGYRYVHSDANAKDEMSLFCPEKLRGKTYFAQHSRSAAGRRPYR